MKAEQLGFLGPSDGYGPCGLDEANLFLVGRHYLGPCPPNGVRLVVLWQRERVAG